MKRIAALIMLTAAFILGIAACGGGAKPQPSPSASHTATPSSAATTPSSAATTPSSAATTPSSAAGHTAQPGEPALIAVPRYDYANISASDVPDRSEMIKSDPQHLQAGSVHVILHDGTMIGVLVLVQVKPAYANLPEFQQGLASSFAEEMTGSGSKMTTETIHTEKVWIAKDSSTVTYCWYHGGTVTVVTGVTGGGDSEVGAFAEAYLKTLHA
jgi:zona occludens toxin (predicted ATPase)